MSNKITDEDIEKAIVKLKPIFGITPGIYLTVIYGLILLLGLFLLLVYPGIKNNGTIVFIDTFPVGAAVYADDTYKGSTPVRIFVSKGTREIRIEKKYFEHLILKKDISGRILGSLLFPKKLKIYENLTLLDEEELLQDRFRQLSSFALIKDYYDRYQMPSLLSETVTAYLAGIKSDNTENLYDFLYSMRVNMGSPEMVLDYIKAISLINSKINSSKISGIEADEQPDFSIILNYFSDKKNINGLVLGIIKAYPLNKRKNIIENLEKIEGVKSIINNLYPESFKIEPSNIPVVTGKTAIINNNRFIGISSGIYLTGPSLQKNTQLLLKDEILTSFPHKETITEFYILEKEITRKDYALFLDENPDWKIENISSLIEKNLVSKDYLSLQDFTDQGKPVSNISWYAAAAYCGWLETKLPPFMSGYTVKLPSEAEWEIATGLNTSTSSNSIFQESNESSAKSVDFSRRGAADLYDTMGNLWEWCDNWYFPTDSVNGNFGLPGTSWDGVEKAVRGGSWANLETEIEVSTRGSQNPVWSTPFLGFRPVLVKK